MERRLYTSGDFDILHYGHILFLEKCFAICSNVIIALHTDEYFEYKNGCQPIMNYEERKKALLLCPWVETVIPNRGGVYEKTLILEIMPSVVVVDRKKIQNCYGELCNELDWFENHQISVSYIPYTKEISSQEIKRRIEKAIQ